MITNKIFTFTILLCFIQTAYSDSDSIKFNGKLNDSILIHGKINCQRYNDKPETGVYAYDKYKKNILLTGKKINNAFLLNEYDENGKPSSIFVSWEDGELRGYWTDHKKYLPLTLTPQKVELLSGKVKGSDTLKFTISMLPTAFNRGSIILDIHNHFSTVLTNIDRCERDRSFGYAWLSLIDNEKIHAEWRIATTGSGTGEPRCDKTFNLRGRQVEPVHKGCNES